MITAPHIYQINTWTWLYHLSQRYGKKITLGSIPTAELHRLAALNVDMIWLMGVWQRSPNGIKIARQHEGLQQDYYRALPNYRDEDVVGSPYSVQAYEVDAMLGTRAELSTLRQQLRELGLGLVLDFVPNHIATDHVWTREHPTYLLQGTPEELNRHPQDFFAVGDTVFAYGRDPYFPAWTDTAQVNAFDAGLRQATIATLRDIASQCDAIRCDMAMLVTNRIFVQTWGARAGDVPDVEFWDEVLPAVKAESPDVLFIAEVYWQMESDLHEQGFDYCYDKSLYDVLERGSAFELKRLLERYPDFQEKLVRFIENHDEQRAITAFGFNRAWMAAVIIATLPGAKLWHEGQFVGHRVRLPVQLGHRPAEPDDFALRHFYGLLLEETHQDLYRTGTWQLAEIRASWEDNTTYQNLIAYTWRTKHELRLVVVNFSNIPAQAYIHLTDIGDGSWQLRDLLNNKLYERTDLESQGLYVDLAGWSAHFFAFYTG